MDKNENKYITVREAAQSLGVNKSFIYRQIWGKNLPAIRLSARRLAIPKADFEDFLRERRTTSDVKS